MDRPPAWWHWTGGYFLCLNRHMDWVRLWDYRFSPLHLNFLFIPSSKTSLGFTRSAVKILKEVLAWAIGGWSQCKFQEACMAQCSLFPMIPHCMSLLATPTDLWLEGIFVPFNFTLDYPALKNACETWKGPFEILLMHSEASQSSLFHSVCWRWVYDWIQFISIKLSTVSIPWVISLRTALHKIGTRNGLMVKHDGKCCDFSF